MKYNRTIYNETVIMEQEIIKITEEEIKDVVLEATHLVLEKRELLNEMARVGYMGKKKTNLKYMFVQMTLGIFHIFI